MTRIGFYEKCPMIRLRLDTLLNPGAFLEMPLLSNVCGIDERCTLGGYGSIAACSMFGGPEHFRALENSSEL
jgi:hypothetical protein